MDYGLISAVAGNLSAAAGLGKAMIGVRDFNNSAAEIAKLNDLLLKAQEGLFAHNGQLLALQQKHFEATEELRKLKESVAQRGRYSLFQIVPGNFVYRMHVTPLEGATGEPGITEPEHYLCQPCFDGGVKSVLGVNGGGYIDTQQTCPKCKRSISTAGPTKHHNTGTGYY